MIRITALILLVITTIQICAQETKYQKNLKLASDLFIANLKLPDTVLLKLVPYNHEEFELLYGTTYPGNKMGNSEFFYTVTQSIFNKVIKEKKEQFYLPSLQLASFADGEFAEVFIDKLEIIVGLDNRKFCKSIKGKKYCNYNPIKYFAEHINCR